MKSLILIALVSIAQCNPTPTPTPAPPADASSALPPSPPGAACQLACSALKTAGCPMGDDLTCPVVMQTINDQGKQANPSNGNRPLTCGDITPTTVKSKADAQRLGFACP